MAGMLVYILISLLIYFVYVDWPWIVFSAATFLALFAGYVTLTRRHYATYIP